AEVLAAVPRGALEQVVSALRTVVDLQDAGELVLAGALEPAGDAPAHERAPAGDVAAVPHIDRRPLLEPRVRHAAPVHGVDEREADPEDVEGQIADGALALGRHDVELAGVEAGHQRL